MGATAVTTLATDIIKPTATVDIRPMGMEDILDTVHTTATEDTGPTTTTETTMAIVMVATVMAMVTTGTALETTVMVTAMGDMVALLMVVTTDNFYRNITFH